MLKYLSFSILLISSHLIIARAPGLKWVKGINVPAGCVLTTDESGSCYITGEFSGTQDFDPGNGQYNLTATGQSDMFLLKLDSIGQFNWAIRIGGSFSAYVASSSIKIDKSNNIYISGGYIGSIDFDPGPGTNILTDGGSFILKLDGVGKLVWVKRIGGKNGLKGSAHVGVDISENVFVSGSFNDSIYFDSDTGKLLMIPTGDKGYPDIFIAKFNDTGHFEWVNQIGQTDEDESFAIAVDLTGNIYTTGYFVGKVDFNSGVGMFYMTSQNKDIFILKLDTYGKFIWVKKMGGFDTDIGRAITIDTMGNIYTIGMFQATADFDPGSGTYNLISEGVDVFISKLNASGQFIWAKDFGGTSYNNFGASVSVDQVGNVYSTGWFSEISDFDPGPGVFNITSKGEIDIFVSKLDSNGNFVWVAGLGEGGEEGGFVVSAFDTSNILISGGFSGTLDFDPGPNTYDLQGGGTFILKLNTLNIPLVNTDVISSEYKCFSLYPNPSNGIFHIVLPNSMAKCEIEIYNALGDIVYRNIDINNEMTSDLSFLSNGIYFIKIIHEAGTISSQKFMKQ